jgi:hypothetical protein
MIAVYYLREGLQPFLEFYYRANLGFDSTTYLSAKSLWMLGALPLSYLLISFVILNREARFTKYQSQLVQAMFFWMVFAVLQILYSKELRPQSFIPLIPGFCFYLCHFLLLIRRRRFAEMNLWILLVGIVGINYFARYDLLPGIDYRPLRVGQSEVQVSGKRILMLGDSLSVYTNNTAAPAFLDWGLTQQIFTQPDYYENVIRVSDAFRKDPPDIIFDPGDLMPGFFARIPALQARYVRVGKGEYHLKPTTP